MDRIRSSVPWRDSFVEQALVSNGFHASGEWWACTLDRIRASNARVIVGRAGRRGGKTTHAIRAILDDALTKPWKVDPGDVGIVAIISARKPQAEDRVATARKYLEAMGIEFIRANNSRIDFVTSWGVCSIRAFAATGGDVVGGTWVAALLDEVARWIDDRGVNPATEVIASAKPALLSTGGRMWLISSPMGLDDAHAKAYALGDSDSQITFYAPTWVAAAELYTEADCRELEPDELLFRREYAAIPTATGAGYWLHPQLLDDAQARKWDSSQPVLGRAAGGDYAFLRDSSALVILERSAVQTRVLWCADWRPVDRPPVPSEILRDSVTLMQAAECDLLCSDSHSRAHVLEHLGDAIGYRRAPADGREWALARRTLMDPLGPLLLPSCAQSCACGGLGSCDRLRRALGRVRVHAEGERLHAEHARTAGDHGDLGAAWGYGLDAVSRLAVDRGHFQGIRARF